MLDARYYFMKAGGLKLLKQYWQNGVLGIAIVQFILLGSNKTSLEILRLSVLQKTKQKLKKKYAKVLSSFDEHWSDDLPHQSRKTIWIFWWQGLDNMLPLVKFCYDSVKEQYSDWEIVLLTEHNYQKYTDIPKYILDKFVKGYITIPHFSDIVRIDLLIRHGGLWLDATVLCTSNNIPKSILNSNLFVYRPQKPVANGISASISNWMIWAKSNNHVLKAVQTLLYAYWKNNNDISNYFLFHLFASIVLDRYSEEATMIPSFCNSVPHILLLHLFDQYDENYWKDVKRMTCFHKLSYKLDEEKCKMHGTYYDVIINNKGVNNYIKNGE